MAGRVLKTTGKGEWSQATDWGGDAAAATEAEAWTGRVTANYTFVKASLQPYVDPHGSALSTPGTDGAFVTNDRLREHPTAGNTMTVRKPATGLSTAAMSIAHGADMLDTPRMKETCGAAEHMGEDCYVWRLPEGTEPWQLVS